MKRREFMVSVALGSSLSVGRVMAAETPLRIASFEADVTTPVGGVLCHGNVAHAKKILDPLTARGIVLLGAGAPIVLCSVDWVGIGNKSHDMWRAALAKAAGTSADRVTVHVVHQHSAPGIDHSTEELLAANGLSGRMFDVDTAQACLDRVAGAVAEAIKTPRRVTHVGSGQGKVEKFASNRRLLGPDGRLKRTRMSSCRNQAAIDAPEGIIDPYCRALSFWDGDRPLAVLTYYATHPQSYYGRGGVSADTVGVARAAREAVLPGVSCVHFDGAGGDIAAGKYNDGSEKNRRILGLRLAQGMKTAWETTKKIPVSAADVAWRVAPVQLPVRASIKEADRIEKLKNTSLKQRSRVFAARDLSWLRRMRAGHHLELGCLRIGQSHVLHMPGELCIEYQLAAAKMRPDDFVCMAAYSDLGPGYICTKIAYSQGGYETGFVSRVAPDVEGVLLDAMRKMLDV